MFIMILRDSSIERELIIIEVGKNQKVQFQPLISNFKTPEIIYNLDNIEVGYIIVNSN